MKYCVRFQLHVDEQGHDQIFQGRSLWCGRI